MHVAICIELSRIVELSSRYIGFSLTIYSGILGSIGLGVIEGASSLTVRFTIDSDLPDGSVYG